MLASKNTLSWLLSAVIFSSLSNNSVFGVRQTSIFDFTVKDINSKNVPMSRYEGAVSLIVNVASE